MVGTKLFMAVLAGNELIGTEALKITSSAFKSPVTEIPAPTLDQDGWFEECKRIMDDKATSILSNLQPKSTLSIDDLESSGIPFEKIAKLGGFRSCNKSLFEAAQRMQDGTKSLTKGHKENIYKLLRNLKNKGDAAGVPLDTDAPPAKRRRTAEPSDADPLSAGANENEYTPGAHVKIISGDNALQKKAADSQRTGVIDGTMNPNGTYNVILSKKAGNFDDLNATPIPFKPHMLKSFDDAPPIAPAGLPRPSRANPGRAKSEKLATGILKRGREAAIGKESQVVSATKLEECPVVNTMIRFSTKGVEGVIGGPRKGQVKKNTKKTPSGSCHVAYKNGDKTGWVDVPLANIITVLESPDSTTGAPKARGRKPLPEQVPEGQSQLPRLRTKATPTGTALNFDNDGAGETKFDEELNVENPIVAENVSKLKEFEARLQNKKGELADQINQRKKADEDLEALKRDNRALADKKFVETMREAQAAKENAFRAWTKAQEDLMSSEKAILEIKQKAHRANADAETSHKNSDKRNALITKKIEAETAASQIKDEIELLENGLKTLRMTITTANEHGKQTKEFVNAMDLPKSAQRKSKIAGN